MQISADPSSLSSEKHYFKNTEMYIRSFIYVPRGGI